MITYDTFKDFYLVKDGMPVTQEILNKAPDQLKKEVDEIVQNLGTVQEFLVALG